MSSRHYIYLSILILSSVLLGASLRLTNDVSFEQKEPAAVSLPDAEPPRRSIALLFVGDIMLSRGVAYQTEKNGGDGKYPFLHIAEMTSAADITFGNLEGPLSDKGSDMHHLYSFRADPKMMEGLTYAGFDVLSLANNHMGDWGLDALADTARRVEAAGIIPVGAGENYMQANGAKMEVIGDTRFGFLAYTNLLPPGYIAGENTPGASDYDVERMKEAIALTEQQADLIIISLHWGEEYRTTPTDTQVALGRALIDAGADIVVGHHPHVVEPVEAYKNGIIIYSLGNFAFDQNFSAETMRGLMVRVTVKDKQIDTVEELPISISPTFQPFLTKVSL